MATSACSGHFFRMTPHFSTKKKKIVPQNFNFFNILYHSSSSRCCVHYEDNIYNPSTTESCLLKDNLKERVNFRSSRYGSSSERVRDLAYH